MASAARVAGGAGSRTDGRWVGTLSIGPAGAVVVRTAQPLGSLAAYLLEPESDDGLFVWNFFDRFVNDRPVHRG